MGRIVGVWGYLIVLLTLAGASAAHPEPRPTFITGVVVREDGTPVAGAEVLPAGVEWDPEAEQRQAAGRTTTDVHGRFRIRVSQPESRSWITAVAEGLSAGSDATAPGHYDLRIVLTQEARLKVRTVDELGAGVPGVRLMMWDGVDRPSTRKKPDDAARSIIGGSGVSRLLAPVTDREGRTVIRHLPRRGRISLVVRDPNWVQVRAPEEEFTPHVSLAFPPAAKELVLRVRRAAAIEGRLLTEGGRPLPGYKIQAEAEHLGIPVVAVTGASGAFRLAGLADGLNDLLVYGAAMPDAALPGELSVQLQPGEIRRELQVVCPTGTLVTGTFIDEGTGEPIAGAQVLLGKPRGDVRFSVATSDASGSFRFRLRPGSWILSALFPRAYDEHHTYVLTGSSLYGTFEAESGSDRQLGRIPVKTRRLPTLRGVVLGPEGKPVPGATVYYREADFEAATLEWTPQVTTGTDGRFEIPSLQYAAGGVFVLRANRGELSTPADALVDARLDPPEQVLHLAERPLATLQGRVVDDAGKPVPRASLSVTDRYAPGSPADPPFPQADAQGRFKFRVWPGDEYHLRAGAKGHEISQPLPLRPRPGVNACPHLLVRRSEAVQPPPR